MCDFINTFLVISLIIFSLFIEGHREQSHRTVSPKYLSTLLALVITLILKYPKTLEQE